MNPVSDPPDRAVRLAGRTARPGRGLRADHGRIRDRQVGGAADGRRAAGRTAGRVRRCDRAAPIQDRRLRPRVGRYLRGEACAHNRWGGFKALRERWKTHVASSRIRPVLLVDEAQEMSPEVLSELRILSSADFDATSLLTVVLSGDGRLLERLRQEDLVPLGTRIRTRLVTEPAARSSWSCSATRWPRPATPRS